jgi:YVTN family beta-propeller protein
MVHVPGSPIAVTVGEGAAWVTNNDDGSVSRIDPKTNRVVARIPVGDYPNAIASGDGAVWVVARGSGNEINTDLLKRIDPATNRVTDAIKVVSSNFVVGSVAVGTGAVWVAAVSDSGALRVARIDPKRRVVAALLDVSSLGDIFDLATSANAVWVTGFDDNNTNRGAILRIDPATNRVVKRIPFALPRCVAANAAGVWVTSVDNQGGTISRIDPATNRVSWTARIGDDPCGIALGKSSVWAANSYKTGDTSAPPVHNSVFQVDARTGAALATIPVSPGAGGGPSCPPCAPGPGGIATGGGSVWVVTDWWNSKTKNTITRIDDKRR